MVEVAMVAALAAVGTKGSLPSPRRCAITTEGTSLDHAL